MAVRIVQDDALHLVIAATPVLIIERDVVSSVEVTSTQGKETEKHTEERHVEHERWERPWDGEVNVTSGGVTLARARTEDGVAHLDLQLTSWLTTAEVNAGTTSEAIDLSATVHLSSWLGRKISGALAAGDLGGARKARALSRNTAAAAAVEQEWCRGAVGPARVAAARDDLSRFVDLLADVGNDGECRTLRMAAGEVAEVQAGLAWASGDRETTRNWVTALRAAHEDDRAERIEASIR